MKYTLSCMALGLVLFVTGCKDKEKEGSLIAPSESTHTSTTPLIETAQPASTITPQINTVSAGGANLNPEHGKPGHRCDIAVGAPLDSKPASATTITPTTTTTPEIKMETPASTSNSGLNPEHGKPGHRCDIAVGAPLSSAPATTSTQPAVNMTTATQAKPAPVTPILPASNSTTTAPGMNPEHGKPGHRCDIAVGAPLPVN